MAEPNPVVQSLMELASCPICYERLRPSATYCVNGHPICAKCKSRVSKCPSCSGKFSEEKHIFLQQLLETLPFNCSYKGCKKLTKDIDHHEKWCGFQPTDCFRCAWIGCAKDLRNHVEKTHALASTSSNVKHNFSRNFTWTYARIQHDQVFWEIKDYDSIRKRFQIQMIWIPNGEIDKDLFEMKVEFKTNDTAYTASTKIIYEPNKEVIGNKLIFHSDMLNPFMDKNSLSYKLWIEKQ